MDMWLKRKEYETALNNILRQYQFRAQEWQTEKAVCVIKGLAGSGKTSFVLEHFKDKKVFYFSFAGLSEESAEKFFAERVSAKTGVAVCGWEDSLKAVSKRFKIVLLDNLASVSSYKRFRKAFYDHMIPNINLRSFIVLITQPTDDISGLTDKYATLNMDYLTVSDVVKLFPKLPKVDILGLCAISGGIPKILYEHDGLKSFEDNLRDMLNPSSAFCTFMPELLARYFRKPESYHYILCAIANGNHHVSAIGKFTGFAYNKCDNYLAGLIDCGFVKTEKIISKRGTEKTVYKLTNSYFRLWYLYIYSNRTELQLGNEVVVDGIIQSIINKEIHTFHLQKAFEYANKQIHGYDMWTSFGIRDRVAYAPQTVSKGRFSYTFDAIVRNDNKAVFIKVLEKPQDSCDRGELETLRKAVSLMNTYYDSCVFIFAKRRFSEYAAKEASSDDVIRLVGVERLG